MWSFKWGCDIGYGDNMTGGTFTLTNSAIVFTKNGTCLTPDTFTHLLYTTNDIAGQKAFGLDVPESWSAPVYVYLYSADVHTLENNVNGGSGTPPESVTQYYNTTTTISDGLGMHNGTLAFSSWNTAADGSGTSYNYGDEYTFTSDTMLYAIYEEVYTQGDGTEGNPFGVSTPEQLNAVRYFPDAHFIMLNDIDMSEAISEGGEYYNDGAGWEPIGNSSVPFIGFFDGGGYEIFGLNIYRPEEQEDAASFIGLFGLVDDYAEIKNVGLIDGNIVGTDYVGGVAGCIISNALVSNCYNTSSVSALDTGSGWVLYTSAGGIAGECSGTVNSCYNTGQIYSEQYAGGISGGVEYGFISNCYNTGSICKTGSISPLVKCAGIVGKSYGSTISNCYNIGSTNDLYGLAGDTHYDTYSNCYYIDNDFHATDDDSSTELINVEAKSVEEMQLQSSFTGFDFENIWTMNGNGEYPCPELQSVEHIEPLNNSDDFAGGNGLPYNPYTISTPAHLDEVRNNLGAWFVLSNDIDLSTVTSKGGAYYHDGLGWDPIGDEEDYFYGRFDGCEYSIFGCNINRSQQDYIGLFGYVENFDMPAVANLSMYDFNITGHDYTAAVVGYSNSIIQSCYSDGITNGNNYTAGIVGRSYKCTDCENAGNVNGHRYVGGITAYSTGIISNCTNSGDVVGENDNVGGILGNGGQQVIDCSNTGSISGNYYIGGIIGLNYANVTSCGNNGVITGISWVGGVVGKNHSKVVTNCYNTNTISSTSYCGGIIGQSDHGHITSCYNTGWVWGRLNGGIVGGIEDGCIDNCFNIGKITEESKFGGIAGEVTFLTTIDCCYNAWNQYGDDVYGFIIDSDENATITNCYYLYEGEEELGPDAKTREELCQQTTFENFDFADIWDIVEGERFPVLQNDPFNYVTGISLNESTLTLNPQDQAYVTPTVIPSNASSDSIMWITSDESIATIDDDNIGPAESGKMRITAIAGGTATITALTIDGGLIDTCEVTVLQSVTGVTLNKAELELYEGEVETLVATFSPENATDKSVAWSSDNESVVTVTDGTVTAVSTGTATITITTEDGGYTDTCTVTVTQPVTGVSLSKSELDLNTGNTVKLTATVTPENANNKSVTWSSNNENVATVDGGTVTATGPGTTTITVTTEDGGYTDTCTVTVTQPVTGVSLSKSELELITGNTVKLTATVTPKNASNKSVTWSSDNKSVAKVDHGTVTAVGPGMATITVTTKDGGFTDTCIVTALQPKVTYKSHVQNIGWQGWVSNGEVSGTSGQSLRLEAMRINVDDIDGGIEYKTHVQNIGWQDWVSNGALTGTSGQSLRLEAIKIRLTGTAAKQYDIYYRVHAQNIGWMGWAKNGESSGTAGFSYRLEAIQIVLVEKGGAAPGSTANAFRENNSVKYCTHVQNIGWQGWVYDGETAGTSGQSLRLEAICIEIDGGTDCIEYKTHVQNIGWQDWVSDGEMSGTSGTCISA